MEAGAGLVPKQDTGVYPMAREREEMQLVSVESNIAALKILLGSSSTPPSDEIAGDLVERAKSYARCTNVFLQDEGFATCVAHFREIVLISWCVVLIYNGFSKDVVDSTMQECISKTKKKNLHRLRTGITWVNRSMARLSENEWGHRSTEIFLLCMSLDLSLDPAHRISGWLLPNLRKAHVVFGRQDYPYECRWQR